METPVDQMTSNRPSVRKKMNSSIHLISPSLQVSEVKLVMSTQLKLCVCVFTCVPGSILDNTDKDRHIADERVKPENKMPGLSTPQLW